MAKLYLPHLFFADKDRQMKELIIADAEAHIACIGSSLLFLLSKLGKTVITDYVRHPANPWGDVLFFEDMQQISQICPQNEISA